MKIILKKKKGFTLIELLIVVAIIAILAAIAIPNFLAAQIRSKVSRVRADLRTIATALESYHVDHNFYPLNQPAEGFPVPNTLTTPVAYITNVRGLVDPFLQPGKTASEGATIAEKTWYTYHNVVQYVRSGWMLEFWIPARNIAYGDWRLISVGPDGYYFNQIPPVTRGWYHTIEYDPTNGTVSMGNIFRSQKHNDVFEWRGATSYWN